MKKLLLATQCATANEYHSQIREQYLNGQKKQAIEFFLLMPVSEQLRFVKHEQTHNQVERFGFFLHEFVDNLPGMPTNSALLDDVKAGKYNYSELKFDIFHATSANDYELSIFGTNVSVYEGSGDGVIEVYTYDSYDQAFADVKAAEKLTKCSFEAFL